MNMMDNFTKMDNTLMYGKVISNEITGEVYTLDPGVKLVYSLAHSCYSFHTSKGNSYTESNESIAKKLGISRSSVTKVMKLLVKVGLVKVNGSTRNRVMRVYNISSLDGWVITNDPLKVFISTAKERIDRKKEFFLNTP